MKNFITILHSFILLILIGFSFFAYQQLTSLKNSNNSINKALLSKADTPANEIGFIIKADKQFEKNLEVNVSVDGTLIVDNIIPDSNFGHRFLQQSLKLSSGEHEVRVKVGIDDIGAKYVLSLPSDNKVLIINILRSQAVEFEFAKIFEIV